MNLHKTISILAVALCAGAGALADHASQSNRTKYNFNYDWKFLQDNPGEAQYVDYDDTSWSTVSCPHTFNDVDTFDDFSKGGHNGESNQWRGTVWYRKHFKLPDADAGKKVFIEFESVRQIADVYINGTHLGTNQTGFIPFGFDLTPYLKFGDKGNVIAVKANNDRGEHFRKNDPLVWNHEHWHPTHGGIYRNVYLHTMDPLHITLPLYDNLKTVGTYVYAENVSENRADVTMEAETRNEHATARDVTFEARILDKDGQIVATETSQRRLAAGETFTFTTTTELLNPHHWYTRHPYLYTVLSVLKIGDTVVDTYETPLGIRSFDFNKDSGFWINGENTKLHGWGQKPTNSWAGLGAALPNWLRDFTFRMMDEAGGNFIRWGHCAGSPAEIAMGDKYGFVTLMPGVAGESQDTGETWDIRIAAFRDMIVYYRNHPSIFIWEGGNWAESAENYQQILKVMGTYDPKGKRLMGNRRADLNVESEKYVTIEVGTEGWEREFGELPIIESEYFREEAPRRVWDKHSPDDNYFSNPLLKKGSYDFGSETFAVRAVEHWWDKMGRKAYHSGGANWIFSDGPHGGRCQTEVTRSSGEVDGVRLPKEAFYATKAMWRPEPQVHVVGHWNYVNGTTKDMYVISNCDTVKLYVNGDLMGTNNTPDSGYVFKFSDIKWTEGTVKVEGYIDDSLQTSQTKRTAGEPFAIKLTPISGPNGWRADGSDVTLIDFEVVDKDGLRCPLEKGRVNFAISGPGVWRGGYNSGKEKSTNNLYLDTEVGINRVSIRSLLKAGTVTVSAFRDGLRSDTIELTSLPVDLEHGLTLELPQVYNEDLGEPEPLPSHTPDIPEYIPGFTNRSELFTKFSYTGDGKAMLRTTAFYGKKAYTDRNENYKRIPPYLDYSEYIRTPDSDRGYWAHDQLQFVAGADMEIYVGHDDRVARPEFLNSYSDTEDNIEVAGATLSLFKRTAKAGESVIMSGNSDENVPDDCRMYVVFGKKEQTKPIETTTLQSIKAVMKRVADWQIEHLHDDYGRNNPKTNELDAWTYGTLYVGMLKWAEIAGNNTYYEWLKGIGEKLNWSLDKKRLYHADDHIVGYLYTSLYEKYGDPKMIEPIRDHFERILENPPTAALEWQTKGAHDRWSWCDALFMGPPVWAKLASVTGNEKYRNWMFDEFMATTDYLYDPEEHLYFRDSRFLEKRNKGKKIFWSRGNGWVIGGLALVLPEIPKTSTQYSTLANVYKQMAHKLAILQTTDGFWATSLLQAEDFPTSETSGTAFYCFALAWGINNGLLDRPTYEPLVLKAWNALAQCVTDDGMLGYVQPIGAAPGQASSDKTEVYGTGAFLAAGAEVCLLLEK